jgi:hypothetical protein
VKTKTVNKKLGTLLMMLLTLWNPSTAHATDPDNVSLIQGQTAPYAGILFPVPRAQRIELMTIDLSTCTKRLDLSIEDLAVGQERNTNLKAEVTRLNEEKNSRPFFSTGTGGFILGLGSAILMAWAISRVTR